MLVLVLDDLRQVFVRSRRGYEPDGGMSRARSVTAQLYQVFGLQLCGRIFVFAGGTEQEEVARRRNAQMVAVLQDQPEAQSVKARLDALSAKIGSVGREVDHADES